MPDAPDCLFCKIRDGKIPAAVTHRDDHVLAFKDISPRAPLHELVIPLKHVASLTDATPADAEMLGRLMLVGTQRARQAGNTGFRVVVNVGPEAGQTVFHVHLHVLAGRQLGAMG